MGGETETKKEIATIADIGRHSNQSALLRCLLKRVVGWGGGMRMVMILFADDDCSIIDGEVVLENNIDNVVGELLPSWLQSH